MPHNVIAEAKRCLNCKNPMCMTGCPIHTHIPDMISMFLNGEIKQAGKMLFDNNPLSLVCSMVCNHDQQCQGHCVRGIKGQPVLISSVEQFISANYLDCMEVEKEPDNGVKVAVVGSGPAGITIALKMAQKGYDVTLFESQTRIGGVLRYGIPEFRLPKAVVDQYEALLHKLGVKVRLNITIGKHFGIEELFRDGFKAISIGTGVTWPVTLNIKGETLGHVHYGVHYLFNPDVYHLGNRVVIIGAGNVAMDVARTALRKGAREVYITCRTDKITASKEEAEYAEIEGAQFVFNKNPEEITDEGVYFRDTVCDENHEMVSQSETATLMPADSVIICISQRPSNLILTQTEGLEINGRGLAEINDDGSTTRKGLFASGDVIRGARTVVEAVETSMRVVEGMDKYLKSLPEDE